MAHGPVLNTYSVEIVGARNNSDVYSMTLETARTHSDAAVKAVREFVPSVTTLIPVKALGGDKSTRSVDRFYETRDLDITVWKHV